MKRLVSIFSAIALLAALTVAVSAGPNTLTLVSSGGSDMVAVSSDGTNFGTPASAVATWKHPSWPMISGSTAVWISSAVNTEDPVNDSWRKFTRTFELCAGAYNMSGSIKVTSDNAEAAYLNGAQVGMDGEVWGDFVDNQEWQTVLTYDLTGNLQAGSNVLEIIVRNYAMQGGTPTTNPTGLIYSAEITYDCPILVSIDIKPGSYPNCFNSNEHGVIPVAILGSEDFDASTVDPFTVVLDGAGVRVKGKSGNAGSLEDVNLDGYMDLVVQIVDDGGYSPGDTAATLTGKTYDLVPIQGTDSICITQ